MANYSGILVSYGADSAMMVHDGIHIDADSDSGARYQFTNWVLDDSGRAAIVASHSAIVQIYSAGKNLEPLYLTSHLIPRSVLAQIQK